MTTQLLALQDKIYAYHNTGHPYNLEYSPRISFSKIGESYEIVFYGEGYDDDYTVKSSGFEEGYNYGFCALLDFLTEKENASKIISLIFTGPDSGANGTRNWDFSRLIHSDVVFENLVRFRVALTDPGDHNQSIIGNDYDEDGMIARLVSKMPKLEELQLPSAPDKSFFELENLQIQQLVIQAGYDHQQFIRNLASATNLKKLMSLDYTDVFDRFGDLNEEELTSFEDYKLLFESEFFTSSKHFHFKLRDPRLTDEKLKELQQIRKVQLLYIDSTVGRYK